MHALNQAGKSASVASKLDELRRRRVRLRVCARARANCVDRRRC